MSSGSFPTRPLGRARSWLVVAALALSALLALLALREHASSMQRAQLDPACSARIVSRRSLRYRAGADPALDRPAHVRAASGVAWLGAQLAVVQDDANFVALVEPESGLALDVPLPVGPNGARLFDEARGTKNLKLDLEACFVVHEAGQPVRLVALGSGSKPARERIVVLDFAAGASAVSRVRVLDAKAFYAQLHARVEFSGSELNLEGAVLHDDALLLFQRGNGEARPDQPAVNAVGELPWSQLRDYLASEASPSRVPQLKAVTQYDLGSIDDVPLSFTDATAGAGGSTLFLASAEASANTVSDGLVHGTRIGELGADGRVRTAPLLDENGAPSHVKAEGIVLDRKDPGRAWVVVDMDDPALASELLEVRLSFPR
jgi:hypothetical protein